MELSDREWKFLEPLLPPRARTGRPRADDRRAVTAYCTCSLRVVGGWIWPTRYGSCKACWRRFKNRSREGVWANILKALMAKGYATGRLSLEEVAVDSITIKARKGRS